MLVIILKIVLLWVLIDGVVIATGWYLVATIRPAFPQWWRAVMAEETPCRAIDSAS